MNNILKKQAKLQTKYCKLEHYKLLDPSETDQMNVGQVVDYIRSMQVFINQEIEELILEIAGDDRAINKPWSIRYEPIREQLFTSTPDVKGEAIDVLLFTMNLLLASGIRPENIEEEYDKVFSKNTTRQKDRSY